MKVYVIIPAFNEAENIAALIEGVKHLLPTAHIVVIDDGSSDDTGTVARNAGATVLTPPYNVGIGGAVQTGLRLAVRSDADFVLRLDGDGQHPPEEIPVLLGPVAAGETDVAIGSRFCPGAECPPVSLPRRIGIFIFRQMTTLLSGQKVTDPTSGFMVMTQQAATFLSKNLAQDYPEVDARVLLARAGFRVREYPTRMLARKKGVSSINTWRAMYYVFKVSLSVVVARSRKIQI
jgi:hypothetical protein